MSVPSIDRKISRPVSWQQRNRPVMRVVSADGATRNSATARTVTGEVVPEVTAVPARRMVVRPDRPTTAHVRALQAVPTAPSPADIPVEVSWTLASTPSTSSPVGGKGFYETARQGTSAEQELAAHVQEGITMLSRAVRSVRMWSAARFLAGITIAILAAVAVVNFFGLGPQAGSVYLVQQGDTVTSIAATVDAPVDTANVIDDIYSLNALEGNVLQPGQEVVLPRYE